VTRGVWILLATICVVAAGAVGYVVGHSGGADVQRAKAAGERAGQSRAAADRRRYRAGYAQGRKEGYREAYRRAYRGALQQASRGSGQ
jgi:hypothetical protein